VSPGRTLESQHRMPPWVISSLPTNRWDRFATAYFPFLCLLRLPERLRAPTDADGGDPSHHLTGPAADHVGYLLRSWLTVQKMKEVRYAISANCSKEL
jgi:hypothetical protein